MNDSGIALIRSRYGFELPQNYQTILANGHFHTSPWDNYWELCDCEWLSPDDIAAYEFLDFQITSRGGFVPFAVSARRDEYCWRLDWSDGSEEPPVVFCERGESGFGYAPHFHGFLYRKLLEEFSGYGPENERGLVRLRRVVAGVTRFLPQPWAARLQQLARRDFTEWHKGKFGEWLLLSRNDLSEVINAELAFPHLNEKFVQTKSA